LFFMVAARYSDDFQAGTPTGPTVPAPDGPVAPESSVRRYVPAALVALLASLAAALPPLLANLESRSTLESSGATLGGAIPGWVPVGTGDLDWKPRFPSAEALRMGRFAQDPELQQPGRVDFYVASFAVIGDAADLTSSVNQVHSAPWSLLGARVVSRGAGGWREAIIQKYEGGRRLVWSWYRVGDSWTTSPVEAEWLTLRALLAGDLPVRELVAISVPFEGDGAAEASAILTAFSQAAGLPAAR
jgi:EpsI family protein